jgi:acyl carrier protein
VDDVKLLEVFRGCAVDVLQIEPQQFALDTRFVEDLEADSLDVIELMLAVEDALGVSVEEGDVEGIETVGQALALIQNKLE